MRIDKYLWHVRLYKTRSIAAEACHKNQVEVNGIQAKASREVKTGDTIRVRKNQIYYSYLILAIPKSRIGAKLVAENIKDITPPEEIERAEMMRLSRTQYVNAYREGRPTKKDRRDMQDYEANSILGYFDQEWEDDDDDWDIDEQDDDFYADDDDTDFLKDENFY